MQEAVIGIDIGGTKIAAIVAYRSADDSKLTVLHETVTETPPESKPEALAGLMPDSTEYDTAVLAGQTAMLTTVIQICRSLLAEASDTKIRSVGIGSAGQIDPVRGVVLDANENIVGWRGAAIAAVVGKALSLPVYVENDVRSMALAESILGAAKSYRHVFFVTVGTGIGGAILLDRQLWHGAHFSAGEIGYLLGQSEQSIETLYAGPAIARHYCAAHDLREPVTLRWMADQARAGHVSCKTAIEDAAHALGRHLAPILAFLDPEAVVIGGGVPQIGDLWWQPFIGGVHGFHLSSVRDIPVLPALLGARAGVFGAAILAMQKADF